MKVCLVILAQVETADLMLERSKLSTAHEVVSDPRNADVIILMGADARQPGLVLNSREYQEYPERCAVYTEEDSYLPLFPGVYCSAEVDQSTRSGRVYNFSYMGRNGRHTNPFVHAIAAPDHSSVIEKKFLFSFQGGSTSFVRKRLFRLNFDRGDVFIENTASFLNWDNSQSDRSERQRRYAEIMAASDFVLCPRGAGAGSIRLFEVMGAGVAPVLISDKYALPPGIDWDSFLVRCREKDIARLPKILEPLRSSAAERGRLAAAVYKEHFDGVREFDRIIELAAATQHHAGPPESWYRARHPQMIRRFRLRLTARETLRRVVLKVLSLLRIDYRG
jgi:hypothetical protein